MNLKIQILVENNEKTIKETLDSIINLNAEIIIGNLRSTDNTIKICQDYNLNIKNFYELDDLSKIRNELSNPNGWNFYINPWEVLIQGHEIIDDLKGGDCCYVRVIENEIVSKEIRFWQNTKFINPICETIEEKNSFKKNGIVIKSIGSNKSLKISTIKKWIDKYPLSYEPYYYLAFYHLSNRDYKNFIICAEQYFLMCIKHDSISSIMMRYYLATIQLHITKQIDKSAKNVLLCLSYCPAFAEFWCLMGDILYHQQKLEKAKAMYENALIIGKRRSNNDLFPIEINKYKKYPSKMVENINKTMNYYVSKK